MARQRRLPIMVAHGGLAGKVSQSRGACLESMPSGSSDWRRGAAAGQMDLVDLKVASASEDFAALWTRGYVPSVPLWHVDAHFGRHAFR